MTNPKIAQPSGYVPLYAMSFAGDDGGAVTASGSNPLPVSVSGTFAMSAVAGAVADIGTGATPGGNTVNGRLAALAATLGTPLQAGGSVHVSNLPAMQAISGTVGVSGTLPAFAATPTFNLGAAPSLTIGALPSLPAGANAIGSVKMANPDGSLVSFSGPAQVYAANTSLSGTGTFSIPQSGFSGNQYLDSNVANSTGFDISQAAGVSISFEGTYAGQSVIPEQTNDLSGLNGWYAVSGQRWGNDGSNLPSAGGNAFSLAGYVWVFPTYGVRMRFRVTAITSGTLLARVSLLNTQPERGANTAILRATTAGAGSLSAARVTSGTTGLIKNSASTLYGWDIANTNAARRYLQFYAKTSAPIVGTDTPYLTISVPPSGDKTGHSAIGVSFYPGFAWAITTDAVGATAGASGDLVFSAVYA